MDHVIERSTDGSSGKARKGRGKREVVGGGDLRGASQPLRQWRLRAGALAAYPRAEARVKLTSSVWAGPPVYTPKSSLGGLPSPFFITWWGSKREASPPKYPRELCGWWGRSWPLHLRGWLPGEWCQQRKVWKEWVPDDRRAHRPQFRDGLLVHSLPEQPLPSWRYNPTERVGGTVTSP